MALAGSAAAMGFAGGISPASAAEDDWKSWVKSYYGKPIKMAVTCYNTTNPYFVPTKVGAEDAGAQLGIDLQWTGVPDANTVNQIAQFKQLVNTGYEAIVVIPLEADAWIAPIKKATDAGVIVVTANSDAPDSARELFFGQDLVGAAVVQGEMLAKLAGNKGDVALTNCAPGLLALDLRIKGAKEGATKGGLNVVNVYNTNPSDMASELSTVKDILKANPGPRRADAALRSGHGCRRAGAQGNGSEAADRRHRPDVPDPGAHQGRRHRRHGRPAALSARLPAGHVLLSACDPPGAEARTARRQLLHGERDRHEGQRRHVPDPGEAVPAGMTAVAAERVLLSARGISKQFGGVRALSNVTLDVRAGEVHGLIGANGAGKSTLIGVLSGAVVPDCGELIVDGSPCRSAT